MMKFALGALFLLGCGAAVVTTDSGTDPDVATDVATDSGAEICLAEGAGWTCNLSNVDCSTCPDHCTTQGVTGICKIWP